MTIPGIATRFEGRSEAWQLGAAATGALGAILIAWAVSMDFVKASSGFISDAATYYEMGHSLANDFDLEYRREDLVRVWLEYPGGPEGLFLKRGTDNDVSLSASFPFITATAQPDGDASRLYYGKSYIYPLFAAPFVFFFGTNGFLVLHAVLMSICFLCAYAFLAARSHPVAAHDLRAGVPLPLGRTHLHGADHAGLLQSGADADRLLLLVLQGNRLPRRRAGTRAAPSTAGCSDRAPISSPRRCSAS